MDIYNIQLKSMEIHFMMNLKIPIWHYGFLYISLQILLNLKGLTFQKSNTQYILKQSDYFLKKPKNNTNGAAKHAQPF